MKVLDHEPQRWFLLEAPQGLLLDANCSHSFISYDVLILLTAEETAAFRQVGRDYLNALSEDIHNSVPILEASTSAYKVRRLSCALEAEATEAIMAWRRARLAL
jgi:hypothetical protein